MENSGTGETDFFICLISKLIFDEKSTSGGYFDQKMSHFDTLSKFYLAYTEQHAKGLPAHVFETGGSGPAATKEGLSRRAATDTKPSANFALAGDWLP